tara:strand:+ start:40399 stop:40869 length:471 start_codon:yes stop_codon:yes gene_type:complete
MPDQKNDPAKQNTTEHISVLTGASDEQDLMKTAISLQTIAAHFGFDWPDIAPVFAKLDEEIQELKYEVEQSNISGKNALDNRKSIEDELGDVLFCCMNLARFLKVDPTQALQSTNNKFKRRFGFIESYVLQKGKKMQDLSLEELDKAWDLAKEKGL